jgi:hypothetical protein
MTQSLWAEFSSDGFEFVVAETWPYPDKTNSGERLAQGVGQQQGLLPLTFPTFRVAPAFVETGRSFICRRSQKVGQSWSGNL